ncbi:MAG: hypothetical protein GC191_18810 [Azospirillum sp.]|nr:hypothetical protein [Azospirillum sp.]
MRRALHVVILAFAWQVMALGAAAAQTATYDLVGTNPGSSAVGYRGTVTLTVKGQVLTVVWKIGTDTSVGTGIANGNTLAVGYPGPNEPGVALYTRNPTSGVVNGYWVPGGGTAVGTETWTPK